MKKMNLLYIGSTLAMLILITIGVFTSNILIGIGVVGFILDTYSFIKLKKEALK